MRILTRAMLRACGMEDTDTVLVALSGGADSTALLYSLCALRDEGAVQKVAAAHMHHGIRGESADADEAFCRSLCDSLSVPFFFERADVPAYAAESGQSLEAAARALRYAFLQRAMRAASAACIVTAHQLDDQAETVLMHLLRGCGTSGLAGMLPRSGDIARPLLTVGRGEVEAYLAERGIAFRTDETNAEDFAMRNRVRHALLPLLDTFRSDSARAIAQTAGLVAEDEAYLCAEAELAMRAIARDGGCQRKALALLPKPISSRVVRSMLQATSDGYTRRDVERVLALCSARTGTRIELSGGRHAWVDSDVLHVGVYPARMPYEVPFARNGVTQLPCGTITATPATQWRKPTDADELFFDADGLPDDAVVRTRRDGDMFFSLGAPGRRKLSDVLTDRKIPLCERDMPLLAVGNEIYAVLGVTIGNRLAITPETRHILHIVFKGEEEA